MYFLSQFKMNSENHHDEYAYQIPLNVLNQHNFTNKEKYLHKLVERNSKNLTGEIDYNKYGHKDGIGFQKSSDLFLDTFIIKVLAADYLYDKKCVYKYINVVRNYIEVPIGQQGLDRCPVTVTNFAKLNSQPSKRLLKNMIGRQKVFEKKKKRVQYYWQQFKVTCQDQPFQLMYQILTTENIFHQAIHIVNIDITLDLKGSFNRQELINYLTKYKNFQMQNEKQVERFSIIDNTNSTGLNCLMFNNTYLQQPTKMRYKLYNKMVQSLESFSVRGSVGNHKMDWVYQTDTRLAQTRDDCKDRGYTRAEITLYCENDIPFMEFISQQMDFLVNLIPNQLVYSTKYSNTWKAYCECLDHSLVVVDEMSDTAIMVDSFNELTKCISGQFLSTWQSHQDYCLANLTLSSILPIDIIYMHKDPEFLDDSQQTIATLTGLRYLKTYTDNTLIFKTKLVKCGQPTSSYTTFNAEKNQYILGKAGFVPHPKCTLHLSTERQRPTRTHNLDLKIIGPFPVFTNSIQSPFLTIDQTKQIFSKLRTDFNNMLIVISGQNIAYIEQSDEITNEQDQTVIRKRDVNDYRNLPSLKTKQPNTTWTIKAVGKLNHYGKEKLIIQLEEEMDLYTKQKSWKISHLKLASKLE